MADRWRLRWLDRVEIDSAAAALDLVLQQDGVATRTLVGSIDSAGVVSGLTISATVADVDVTFTDNTTGNVTSTKHGFAPKSPADATKFLNGAATPTYAAVKDSDLSTTDITTNDVTSTKHGFAPKSPADATKFLNGAATPAFAAVKDSDLSTSDITTNDVTSTKHGFAPKSPADATKFLNGAATPAFALVKDSDLSTSDITTNDVTTSKHGFAPKAPNDSTKFLRGDATWSTLPGAGGAAWFQIGSWDYSTNVTNVPITGLTTNYNEWLIVCYNITTSASTAPRIQWSVDNGGSYLTASGDAISIASGTGIEANATPPINLHGTSTTSARTLISQIINTNTGNADDKYLLRVWPNADAARIHTSSALNALKIDVPSGNITGGHIRVYGR